MTENQILVLLCVFVVAMRMPRIRERWSAPLLRGPEWFFSVAVKPDFWSGPGAAILRNYRWRLFIPWAIEIPIFVAILIAGRHRYIFLLILVITLLTRLNYYAARQRAEDQARRFELPGASQPVATVALSLQPRTLGGYTNWWVEAAIGLALGASLAWLGYRYAATRDWQAVRGPLSATIVYIYLQAGLLLIKRALVRARSVAPADNAVQYLAWRESLRRLSTAICDYVRLLCVFGPLVADLQSIVKPWAGSGAEAATMVAVLGAGALATVYEWRRRRQYLEVARQTRPAKFLVLPDIPDAGWLVCFRPSLPVLLLNGPNGYALNLASAPAKVAGLYIVGYAALLVWLTR
jgi:hypothetical protein